MKRPKLAVVLLLLGVLLAYLMFMKRHYGASEPDAYRAPPPPQRGPAKLAVAPGRNSQFGIMFDAGSTGTRIHVFEFQMETSTTTVAAVIICLSLTVRPLQCAAGLTELLKVAESSIPPSSWTLTPVVLKATAGLRLLDGAKAKHLLDTVRALFTDSPFLSRDDSVSVMDGTDEVTCSSLSPGDLHSPDASTVGMLDLGGGSTQITFSPQDEKTIQTSPIDHIRSFRMFNSTHTVYTHSYLGLGLMSARLSVLGGIEAPPLEGSTELVSPCLAPESSGSWEHADVVYRVTGQKAGEPVYEACRTKVEKVLYRKVVPVSEAADVDFYAFSYYYDRAVDLGLIGEETGGTVRVVDYMEAAKRVCSSRPVSPLQSPFLCLDLVYISVLLHELGFPPNKQFKLARTINQVETSWALGATFHYIEFLKSH
uniref:Ectonucleoside triphosphate diphosphohydrolase 6 n=1 Tax=Gasterosteus aculeatus aculeatus TaxID=481459 RepID=A0AAQ4QMV0_GASAC